MLTVSQAQMDKMAQLMDQNLAREIAADLRVAHAATTRQFGDETFLTMVEIGIVKARQYNCTEKYAIAMFSELMLIVGPCFNEYPLVCCYLEASGINPDARVDNLLRGMTEAQWEKAKQHVGSSDWPALIRRHCHEQ